MAFIGKLDIPAHIKVQVPIPVHIQKTGPRSDMGAVIDPGLLGNIRKGAVAIIAVEHIRAVIIEIQIRVPVVIIVTDGDP
jgi:hypothetical protein